MSWALRQLGYLAPWLPYWAFAADPELSVFEEFARWQFWAALFSMAFALICYSKAVQATPGGKE